MKLRDIILTETAEEDRAIISLASAIAKHLERNADQYDDPDSYSYGDDDGYDESGDEDQPVDVGMIGDLFVTPIDAFNQIRIQVQSDYGIRQSQQRENNASKLKRPGETDVVGLWYNHSRTLVINADSIGTPEAQSFIAHELRHALDDVKSDFVASNSTRYSTPRNKAHRQTNDPRSEETAYLAEPAEINARFVQVLDALVPFVAKTARLDDAKANEYLNKFFMAQLKAQRIAMLFPEKEKSKHYKRLIKRGVDFYTKELQYQKSLRKQP